MTTVDLDNAIMILRQLIPLYPIEQANILRVITICTAERDRLASPPDLGVHVYEDMASKEKLS